MDDLQKTAATIRAGIADDPKPNKFVTVDARALKAIIDKAFPNVPKKPAAGS
jgi:hypothetical protein